MYRQGWTDGLPVVPPTEDRVAKVLDYLKLPAEAEIAELPPMRGLATVEKIAVNAVMAGCAPEYVPVVIAAVEAIAEPRFNLQSLETSTGGCAVAAVVNGPIRKVLDINCGRNCMDPGRRSNATIGRAIRLVIRNVGGASTDIVSKSIHGNPARYTFCFGENEEESPWEPLHVERGFAREVSTVTVLGTTGITEVMAVFPNAQGTMLMTAKALAGMTCGNVIAGGGEPVVVWSPGHAKRIAEAGFSKAAARQFMFPQARVPLSEFPPNAKVLVPWIEREGMVWAVEHPEDIVFVVAGGSDPYSSRTMSTFASSYAVTKPVRIPARVTLT